MVFTQQVINRPVRRVAYDLLASRPGDSGLLCRVLHVRAGLEKHADLEVCNTGCHTGMIAVWEFLPGVSSDFHFDFSTSRAMASFHGNFMFSEVHRIF